MQAAKTPKPDADKQLYFQLYRNPAAIIPDAQNKVWQWHLECCDSIEGSREIVFICITAALVI